MSCTASLYIFTACSIESNPGCWLNHNAARPSTCSRCSFASQRPKAQREDRTNRECNVTMPAKNREVRFAHRVTRTKLSPAPPGEPCSVVGKDCFSGNFAGLTQHVVAAQLTCSVPTYLWTFPSQLSKRSVLDGRWSQVCRCHMMTRS